MKRANSRLVVILMRGFAAAAVVAAVLGMANRTEAAPLTVGGTQFPVAAEAGQPAPGAVADPLTGAPLPFVGFGFSGTLTSTVWRNDATNPFGPTALTFTYLLTNDAASAHVIHRMTVGSYGTAPTIFTTDVSHEPGGAAGVVPTLADRTTSDVIGFSFASVIPGVPGILGHIPPGGASKLLVVQTDAISFAPTFASVINGTVATVASWAPLTQIPEPGTWILGSLGLVGLIGVARRMRK
jgi:hypothetical protein